MYGPPSRTYNFWYEAVIYDPKCSWNDGRTKKFAFPKLINMEQE